MSERRAVKRGRKPKLAKDRQSEKVLVAFTPGELRELQRAASKQPLAAFVRELTLRHLARRKAQRARRKREGEET